MNIDVKHKGLRGGTARTRYFGQIEGVSASSKDKLIKIARERNISMSDLLDELISELRD